MCSHSGAQERAHLDISKDNREGPDCLGRQSSFQLGKDIDKFIVGPGRQRETVKGSGPAHGQVAGTIASGHNQNTGLGFIALKKQLYVDRPSGLHRKGPIDCCQTSPLQEPLCRNAFG